MDNERREVEKEPESVKGKHAQEAETTSFA